MDEAKALALTGAFIFLGALVVLGALFGAAAAVLAFVGGFGLLMLCVGAEALTEVEEKDHAVTR